MTITAAVRAARAVGCAALVILLAWTWRLEFLRSIGFRASFLRTIALLSALVACAIRRKDGRLLPKSLWDTRLQAALLLCAILLGAAARTARSDLFPPADGQWAEEAQTGGIAWGALNGGALDPTFPLTDLEAEAGLKLFGRTMGALRTPFIILGIAAVPLFFTAARMLFATWFAAFFATCLFATCPYLAGSSRIALETMSPVATECFALAATFYAASRRDFGSFALAGLANGLLLLEHFSFKLLPPLAFVFLLLSVLDRPDLLSPDAACRPLRFKKLLRSLPGLCIFTAALAAVLVPLLLESGGPPLGSLAEGLFRHRAGLAAAHAKMSSSEVAAELLRKARESAFFLFRRGEVCEILPTSMGIVGFWTGIAGTGALAWCLLRARTRPSAVFLPLAVAAAVILGGMLVLNPARYRLAVAVPCVFLAIGMVVDDALVAFPSRKVLLAWVFSALLVFLCARDLFDYFFVALRDPCILASCDDVNIPLGQAAASIQAADPAARIYILTDQTHLAGPSDYAFLYDYTNVRVLPQGGAPPPGRAFILAHDRFIPAARALPGLRECAEWRARNGRYRILRCVKE